MSGCKSAALSATAAENDSFTDSDSIFFSFKNKGRKDLWRLAVESTNQHMLRGFSSLHHVEMEGEWRVERGKNMPRDSKQGTADAVVQGASLVTKQDVNPFNIPVIISSRVDGDLIAGG